ncbi:MAG: translocation/assembly module TamB domain-containing protein, partial [Burkholderiaceae bacterium]|nr:translocation/assembly module TamB domain-containing protein [Burkholderiaceae bacterium]
TALLAVSAAGGVLWWAWHDEAALPWLLQRVPGLSAQGVRGTLQRGRLQVDALDLQLPAAAGRLRIAGLQLDGLALHLWPRPGQLLALNLRALHAERLQFDSGPPGGAPPQAPADLRLPLDLQITQVTIGELRIDQQPPLRQLQAALALGADGGRLHRLAGASAVLDLGPPDAPAPVQLQAELQIGADAPLPLRARIAAQRLASAASPGWQASLHGEGPVTRLASRLQLSGEARAGAAPQRLEASATLLPFAAWPLADLVLKTEALDLAALSPRLPQTRLDGSAEVQAQGLDQPARVTVRLHNGLPGAWDRGRLPIQALDLAASGTPRQTDRLTFDAFALQLGDAAGAAGAAGQLTGRGRWQADTLALELQLVGLRPARLHRQAANLVLGGPLELRASGLPLPAAAAAPRLAFTARLSGRLLDGNGVPVQLALDGDASRDQLHLRQAEAQAGAARARGTLDARAVPAGWQLRGQLALRDFDPRPWWRGAEQSAWRRGPHRLSATLAADLLWQHAATRLLAADTLALDRLLAAVDGQASLQIDPSLLAGVPLSGALRLHSRGPTAEVDGTLSLAGNQLALSGQGGGAAAADAWQLRLQAPSLAALAPLGEMLAELAPAAADAWPRGGTLDGSLKTAGRWPAMRVEGTLAASNIVTAQGSLQSATLSLRSGGDPEAPLSLQAAAQGLARGNQRLDRLQAEVSGSLRNHALRLLIDSPLRPPAWAEALLGPAGTGTRFEAEARGQWTPPGAASGGSYRWQAMALKAGARDAEGGSRPWLAAQGLAGALTLDATGALQSLQAEPGRVQLLATALNWRELQWRADGGAGRLDVAAVLETIAVAPLLERLQPGMGWGGTLTLGGRIDIHSAARFDADIVLERVAGDLSITDDLDVTQSLGLSDLRLALSAHDGLWQLAQGLAGRRVGTVAGAQLLRTTPDRRLPDLAAPLQGVLEARVADLGVWGAWMPPGWRLSGRLDTVAQFGGTLGAPEVRGSMRGEELGARNLLQGVNLTDGRLELVLEGENARIEHLSVKAGAGRLGATGGANLGAEPSATLRVTAEQFRVLGRVDRRLVVSGDAAIRLDRQRLQLDGALAIDEGLFDIGRSEAPSLDSDVVVHRGAAAGRANGLAGRDPAAPAPPPLRNAQIDLKLDLGQKLRLRGMGVDTLLRGELVLSSPGGRPALHGTVRAQDGLYAAYGQKLEITRGEFVFNGPIDNPRLDVLALRPNLDVEVGVTIVGSAGNPRIRLYSNPDMADYDKLSWLLLGRASEGLGTADAALLQRAAYALLAGDSPGPTEQLLGSLGLTEFSVKQTEGDTRDTVVSLGKQLSRRWWVGYERGVHATTGTWQVIYRVAQRFTLRAQSGEENALDLIWTWRW